ncbi:hypothetical protein Sme01_02570 [Sphaerisporangium melleum]|uniref:Uncharacterized protein n=1 Tax=Sphaerisporangium melleum TaxID=321316 RepID=A0A917VBW0_9ACTN|nr:hypothetical protein [Sphaerisporangium melleum]GGK60984.1 hypothetical protein GCM10007964_00110 [Sphaerisporangium melleum]GII67781.1 hypothetical protein Sme01_02570 [Sphaerisporangium melleum]
MNWMQGLWIALGAGIVVLVWTRQTKVIELISLVSFGILTGAMLAGRTTFAGMSISSLWNAFFQ